LNESHEKGFSSSKEIALTTHIHKSAQLSEPAGRRRRRRKPADFQRLSPTRGAPYKCIESTNQSSPISCWQALGDALAGQMFLQFNKPTNCESRQLDHFDRLGSQIDNPP
jgi:hypothetical protein